MRKSLQLACVISLPLAFANCMDSSTQPSSEPAGREFDSPVSHREMLKTIPRPEKFTFIKASEIELHKGDQIPKGTFILKEGETEDSYMRTSSGPWNFSGLAKQAKADNRTLVTGSIQRINVVSGNSSTGCPSGTRLDFDLNRGAGGPFIYLCGKSGYNDRIKPSSIYVIDKSNSAAPANEDVGFKGVGNSNSDLNQGAGGDYIYGRYEVHSGDCGLEGIGVQFRDHWWESTSSLPSGWHDLRHTYDADINDGAGGASIFFIFKTQNGCWQ